MGDNTRRQFLKATGISTLGLLGVGNVTASDTKQSAVEAGIDDKLESLYTDGDFEEILDLLKENEITATTRKETRTTQPSDSEEDISPQHWFNKGDSTITHAGFLWKKASNHDYLANDVYQCDVSWDLNRTSQDAPGITLDSPAPMDQAIIAFDKSRWDYLPETHEDGGLRYDGKIFDSDGSEMDTGQCYVKNEPTPTADKQDAAVVSFDDGEINDNLDSFPAQGKGFAGIRVAHTGSDPGMVETYFSHTWSAFDIGRWTGVVDDLTADLPFVNVGLSVPTGIDTWKDNKAYYKG